MLSAGVAKKVTIHLNEDTTARHDFLYNEIFALLKGRGVAGATLIRTAAGFGTHHRLHSTEGGLAEKEHLPVRIEFIDSDRPLGNCAALAEVRVSCIRVNECAKGAGVNSMAYAVIHDPLRNRIISSPVGRLCICCAWYPAVVDLSFVSV